MKISAYIFGLLLYLLPACTLNPSSILVDVGLITPSPTPDPYAHYRSSLQPWARMDIETLPPLTRYHITARLNREQTELTGVAQITIPNPPEELIFRIYPNLENYGGQMTLSQALVNNTPVHVTLLADGTAIRLPSPAPSEQAPLEPAVVKLEFTTTLPGVRGQDKSDFTLFGWDGPILSLPGFYPTLAVKQVNDWVLDQPPRHGDVLFNEVALYQLDLTVPDDLIVAASGVTRNMIDRPDGSRTWQIVGGPLRDMSVIAGPFLTVSETAAGAAVTAYYLPEHEAAGLAVLAHAAASLRLYSDLYGPYPYTELDVVEGPLNVRGMEYSGLILIGEDLYQNQREYLTFLVAHEVGHQWWSSLVGNNPYDHPWLDEGLTEYGAFDYYRGVFGRPDAEQLLLRRWQLPFDAVVESGIDGQVDRPAQAFDPTSYELLVYGKAALFFHALREALGEEVYFEVLQTYFAENKYRIATPQTLLATAERVSGQNPDQLREKWLK